MGSRGLPFIGRSEVYVNTQKVTFLCPNEIRRASKHEQFCGASAVNTPSVSIDPNPSWTIAVALRGRHLFHILKYTTACNYAVVGLHARFLAPQPNGLLVRKCTSYMF